MFSRVCMSAQRDDSRVTATCDAIANMPPPPAIFKLVHLGTPTLPTHTWTTPPPQGLRLKAFLHWSCGYDHSLPNHLKNRINNPE